jgi:hypothetical protein
MKIYEENYTVIIEIEVIIIVFLGIFLLGFCVGYLKHKYNFSALLKKPLLIWREFIVKQKR